MYGFKCSEFAKPVYFGLRVLKRDILRGATGRDALSVALFAASHIYKQPGGAELLRGYYDTVRTTAPSEMLPLFAIDPDPPPAVVEPPREHVVQTAGR